MAPATFLHIHAEDGSPARVLELLGETVRIGSGLRCEVRLTDPDLPEVQCLLKHRGAAWHVLPVGPTGCVFLDGRPVDGQCVLTSGALLRVGANRLMMRTAGEAAAPLGSFERPITVEPIAGPPEPPRGLTVAVQDEPEPAPPPTTDSIETQQQRLAAWQAHLDRRERLLRERERERRVAARWRAAGEHVRSGSPPAAPAASSPLRVTPRIRVAPDEPASSRPQPSPAAKRPTGFVLRGRPTPTPSPGRDESGPTPAVTVRPEAHAGGFADDEPLDDQLVLPVVPAIIPVQKPHEAAPDREPDEPAAGGSGESSAISERQADRQREDDPPAARLDSSVRPRENPVDRAEGEVSEPPAASEAVADEPIAPHWPDHGAFVAHTGQDVAWSWQRPIEGGRTPAPLALAPPTEPEWPSARDLIAAHREAKPSETRPAATDRASPRLARRPQPTVGQTPASWSVPAWVGVGPVGAGVLVMSALALLLTWTWGQDDRVAGLLADRLLAPGAATRGPIDAPDGPGSAWWATTSGHLYLRALADSRREGDPDRDELVRFDLEAARGAAPLDRAVRLATATDTVSALGLSHDVASQRKTGQVLLKAGKTEAGLAALRRAMELASRADVSHAAMPSFVDDTQVRRFTLPNEDLMAAIARDALGPVPSTDDLGRVEATLPDSPLAALAAFRVLRDRGTPGAERLLDRVLAPSGPAADPMVSVAQAEALAYRGGLDEAAERYREAIEAFPRETTIHRALALNLADLERRLGHEEAMREAWDAARGANPSDPINVRLTEARQQHGDGGRPGFLTLPPPARRDQAVAPATFRPQR
jgi:hypothetical protein